MNRRAMLKLACLGPAWLAAGGFIIEPAPGDWSPHQRESSDPLWPVLNGAALDYDPARGVMTARFTDAIRRMDGRTITVTGFFMPLDPRPASAHFLLTRRNSACPFCPGNEPTEAIEIFASQPFGFSRDPLEATGRFQLVSESADGLFYRLHNAQVKRQ